MPAISVGWAEAGASRPTTAHADYPADSVLLLLLR